MSVIIPTPQSPTMANGTTKTNPNLTNTSLSPTNSQSPNTLNPPNPKPTTMPVSRKLRLQQMLWHSLMEAKGEIVGVTKTNGDTFSGVLFAIEAADNTTNTTTPNNLEPSENNPNTNSNPSDTTIQNPANAAWKFIVLKYVQKMADPNMNPSTRIKTPFLKELKIPASDFASLSAINIIDHTNSYRRSDRQAFNDATGKKLHRKKRELVRWESTHSMDGDELENEDDLDDLRNGSYDQFKANEKYGIKATFDESIYTANLDKNDPEYSKNYKEAQLDEDRIMSTVATNKHVADDRAYYNSHYEDVDKDKDRDEEDMYSRVLHEASKSKLSLKEKGKTKGGYVPPHMRQKGGGNHNNQNQNNQNQGKGKKNKGQNKGNNNNRDRSRPTHNNNKLKNQNQNQTQHQNPNQNQHNPMQNQNPNPNQHQTQGNFDNNNVGIVETLTSPNNGAEQQNVAALQQASALAALQNQIQQTSLIQQSLFSGLPPHIAQIVQSVHPTQQSNVQNALTNAQHNLYNQLLQPTQHIQSPNPNENDNNKDTKEEGNKHLQNQLQTNIQNIPEFKPTNIGIINNNNNAENEGMNIDETGMKDDAGHLNPHAIEFTPGHGHGPSNKQQNNNNPTQQAQPPNITPNTSAHELLLRQQQQALQAQLLTQQGIGQAQYNYNPATGQFVLNPYAQQGVGQQQLQLLQQQQQQAYLQQLAIQQQLQLQQGNAQIAQQSDPTANMTPQQQQQLIAHHQQQAYLQQQHIALAQQAQATGMNIQAPLFTPSTNIGQNQQQQHAQVQAAQAQVLLQQQQQQALLQQAQQQAQQQYLPFGTIQQQQQPQFYMQNMQNLMQQ